MQAVRRRQWRHRRRSYVSAGCPRAYAARRDPGLEACEKSSRVARATVEGLALVHDIRNIAFVSAEFNSAHGYLASHELRERSQLWEHLVNPPPGPPRPV